LNDSLPFHGTGITITNKSQTQYPALVQSLNSKTKPVSTANNSIFEKGLTHGRSLTQIDPMLHSLPNLAVYHNDLHHQTFTDSAGLFETGDNSHTLNGEQSLNQILERSYNPRSTLIVQQGSAKYMKKARKTQGLTKKNLIS
jgi:hypothetical protein